METSRSYGMPYHSINTNMALYFAGSPTGTFDAIPVFRYKKPASTILMGDYWWSNNKGWGQSGQSAVYGASMITSDKTRPERQVFHRGRASEYPKYNGTKGVELGNGSNLLFVDGHAEFITFKELCYGLGTKFYYGSTADGGSF